MLRLQGMGIDGNMQKEDVSDLKKFDIFVEKYTCRIYGKTIDRIEKETGKKVITVDRSALEEGAESFVAESKNVDRVLLVGGDPLIATTHKILYLESLNQKIGLEIYHSSSVFTAAIGESGLDFYRFGAVCTVAEWKPNYKPVSFYEKIKVNFENDLHTLILLDFDSKNRRSIELDVVLDILINAEKQYGDRIINKKTKLLLMMDLGTEQKRIVFNFIDRLYLMKLRYNMACIIIPARLTKLEIEVLSAVCEFYDRNEL